MLIGVTGFSWSGSSAVKEFIREFDGIQYYRHEFPFAYYPDGLCDLDYHLNENVAKFMSSGVAIPRFRKLANVLLRDETHGRIKPLTEEYLDSLVQAKWIGAACGQMVLRSNYWFYLNVTSRFARHVVYKLPWPVVEKWRLRPVDVKEFSIRPDDFLEKTQKYTDGILEAMGFELDKPILMDQPFPGNSPERSMQYFRGSKAIIVDRDPRDIYLFVHERFPERAQSVPHNTVEDYAEYYRHLHKTIPKEGNPDVLYIRFEDLIYEYEATTAKIREFLGLGDNPNPMKFFNPNMSRANTRLFEKGTKYIEDIRKIEELLPEYLYDFSKYPLDTSGEIFDINPLTNSN